MSITRADRHKYLFLMVILFSLQSCTTFQENLYVEYIDSNTGDYFLMHEDDVKQYLENVLNSSGFFTIRAYTRDVFSSQKKKTKLLTHSFYVITNNTGEHHTISFYGSKVDIYSRGVWVMDADGDRFAYNSFIAGNNKWDVSGIIIPHEIDIGKTIENIIYMIENPVRYYYKDHLTNKSNMYNCNTALIETLVEKKEFSLDHSDTEVADKFYIPPLYQQSPTIYNISNEQ